LRSCNGSLRDHVTRVERRGGLEEQDVDFSLGDRPMLDASRNDDELALGHGNDAISEMHVEAPVQNEEELVFVLVLMPNEFALELDELHVLAVQLTDDLRIPVSVESRELFAKVDLLHATSWLRIQPAD
jgi:hypothetical protein